MLGQTYAESGSKPSSKKNESEYKPPHLYRVVKVTFETGESKYVIEFKKDEYNYPWSRLSQLYDKERHAKEMIKYLQEIQKEKDKKIVKEEIIE